MAKFYGPRRGRIRGAVYAVDDVDLLDRGCCWKQPGAVWFQLYVMRDRDFIRRLTNGRAPPIVLPDGTLDLQLMGQRHRMYAMALVRRQSPRCRIF